MRVIDQILGIESNVEFILRERGKVRERREGHNVFTVAGKNLLSKLMPWSFIGTTDVPYTNRRVRWMGVGIGSQLEVTTVSAINQPVLVTDTDYLSAIQSVEFPTSTSVRFIKEFGTGEITIVGTPVTITEAALFADVSPANMGGTEDVGYSGVSSTTLDPTAVANAPISYKVIEGLTKTVDFTLEIRWEYRF
jgi:hypothetical protein